MRDCHFYETMHQRTMKNVICILKTILLIVVDNNLGEMPFLNLQIRYGDRMRNHGCNEFKEIRCCKSSLS